MSQHQFHYILNLLEDDINSQLVQVKNWQFVKFVLCRDTVKFNVVN